MNKHIFLLFSLLLLLYGVTIRPIKNIDFSGSVIMQKGWHHEFQFISEIDASYSIELKMDYGNKTENSKDKLSSQVRYKVTDKATKTSQEKVIQDPQEHQHNCQTRHDRALNFPKRTKWTSHSK